MAMTETPAQAEARRIAVEQLRQLANMMEMGEVSNVSLKPDTVPLGDFMVQRHLTISFIEHDQAAHLKHLDRERNKRNL